MKTISIALAMSMLLGCEVVDTTNQTIASAPTQQCYYNGHSYIGSGCYGDYYKAYNNRVMAANNWKTKQLTEQQNQLAEDKRIAEATRQREAAEVKVANETAQEKQRDCSLNMQARQDHLDEYHVMIMAAKEYQESCPDGMPSVAAITRACKKHKPDFVKVESSFCGPLYNTLDDPHAHDDNCFVFSMPTLKEFIKNEYQKNTECLDVSSSELTEVKRSEPVLNERKIDHDLPF